MRELPSLLTLSSLYYACGYLTGLAAFIAMGVRRRMQIDVMLSVLAVAFTFGIFGAIFVQWIVTGELGRTILGGFAVGYLAVALYKKFYRISIPTGDLFAVALSAGEAVGRWGCWAGGCCYGRACSLPWAIRQHGEMRHPTQIYMSLAAAIVLAILLYCESKRPPVNFLFYLQGTLYCVFRFIIEFYREVPHISMIGLSAAQVGCVAGFLFFGALLYRLVMKNHPLQAPAPLSRENANA